MAHQRSGNNDLAVLVWDRAAHVSHINFEPHNYGEVESLANISRVLSSEERYKNARKSRRRIHYLAERELEATYRSETGPISDP